MKRVLLLVLLCCILDVAISLSGCGSGCTLFFISVNPQFGDPFVSHMSPPPGNQIGFVIIDNTPNTCGATKGQLKSAVWSTSDPVNTSISRTQDGRGIVTCLGPTQGPVTITATVPAGMSNSQPVTGTSTLTCR